MANRVLETIAISIIVGIFHSGMAYVSVNVALSGKIHVWGGYIIAMYFLPCMLAVAWVAATFKAFQDSGRENRTLEEN